MIPFINDVWLFDSRGQFAWFASYIPKVSNFNVVVFDEIDNFVQLIHHNAIHELPCVTTHQPTDISSMHRTKTERSDHKENSSNQPYGRTNSNTCTTNYKDIIDDITDITYSFINPNPVVKADPANAWAQNNSYEFLQKTNDFTPYSRQDLINILYTVLDIVNNINITRRK